MIPISGRSVLQSIGLRPIDVYPTTGRRVPNLSEPIYRRHAHRRQQPIHNEGAYTSPTHIGHTDRAKSDGKDPPTVPIRLHLEGVEAIQHTEREVGTDSALTSYQLPNRDSPSTEEETKLTSKIPYASTVGSIMYAMVVTRPDLAYVIGVVSRYMSNPERKHWEAMNNISTYNEPKIYS